MTIETVSQELAALYRAEAKLLERAHAMRGEAILADHSGSPLQAAAFRGKAVGLHQGAQQIASVAASIRRLEEN